jgi:hypothetical protein
LKHVARMTTRQCDCQRGGFRRAFRLAVGSPRRRYCRTVRSSRNVHRAASPGQQCRVRSLRLIVHPRQRSCCHPPNSWV